MMELLTLIIHKKIQRKWFRVMMTHSLTNEADNYFEGTLE